MIISKSSHIQKKPLAGPSLVPGGGSSFNGLHGEAPPGRGTFFRLQGGDFARWSIRKGREICHLSLWKGPKG